MIRAEPSPVQDWLDSHCWSCGTPQVAPHADNRLLCGSCREDLDSEPAADPVGLARHAYWESHALACCWRCLARSVDPEDEIGMCSSCREQIGRSEEEGAA